MTIPTNSDAGRENFRTSVIQLDRPGDPSVFGEQTRAEAAEIIARYPAGQSRSALLPLLHLVQSEQGYVTADGIAFCADTLGITKAQVSAVVTFYTMYKRTPTGEYLVSVCTNTLCGMLGGDDIFAALGETLGRRRQRDHRRRQDHPRARRVPGRLRLRAGRHGELRVLRQPDRRLGPQVGERTARGRAAAADPRRTAVLVQADRAPDRRIPHRRDPGSRTRTAAASPPRSACDLPSSGGDTAPSYSLEQTAETPTETSAAQAAAQPTSAHDAPLETSVSDEQHPQGSGGDAEPEPGKGT